MSVSDLRQQYPELGAVRLVEADIVDNGETISSIADNSWDFAIANHMIEHCQNPRRSNSIDRPTRAIG
jgi:hypothetical protein